MQREETPLSQRLEVQLQRVAAGAGDGDGVGNGDAAMVAGDQDWADYTVSAKVRLISEHAPPDQDRPGVTDAWAGVIARYQPSLMWNDIAYPTAADLNELFAHYYNSVPEGVINDRFSQMFGFSEG